jgi:anti-anti-sigma factor
MDLSAEFCWIDVVAGEDAVAIHVRGEIDLATGPLLDAALDGVDGHRIEVDLSATTFCDAAGLRVLDLAHQRFGPRLRVTGVSPMLQRLAAILDMQWIAADAIEADPPVA